MIPDLCFGWPSGGEQLGDVKTLHCGDAYLKTRNHGTRPVDTRANRVSKECVKDARELDQERNGVPEGTVGPVEAKLLSFGKVVGLVFGAFGEASDGVHALVRRLAGVAVQRGQHDLGWWGGRDRLSAMVWSLRRMVGMVAWRALVRLRLHRLRFVGTHGLQAAARRRAGVVVEEEWRRGEVRRCVWEWKRAQVLGGRRDLGWGHWGWR